MNLWDHFNKIKNGYSIYLFIYLYLIKKILKYKYQVNYHRLADRNHDFVDHKRP